MSMWQLWQGLKNPNPNHPIFMRVCTDIDDDKARLFGWIQHVLLQGQIWLWPLLFILDMRLVCLMALSGSFSGLVLATRISGHVVKEQASRTFDLLGLTPGGSLSSLWAVCTGCLHRHNAFDILNSQEAWIVRFGLFIPFIVSSHMLIERLFRLPNGINLTWGIGFIIWYYIDHIQSTVFGCISGMLAAYTARGVDPRLWAALTFASFQIGSYVFTVMGSLIVLHVLLPSLITSEVGVEISQILVPTGIFALSRALVIAEGWRRLLAHTNTTTSELDFLVSPGGKPQMKLI